MASLRQRRPPGVGRWALAAAATAVLCAWSLATGCATGDVGTDDDDGAGASGNQGGGVGASTTSSSTGTGGTGATSTGTGLSGGSGGSEPCPEDPCKLTLPQCGCPQGQKCTFHSTQGAYCIDDGTIDGGEECLGSGCKAGYFCVGYVGPPQTCHQFCADDGDCEAPGGVCILEVSGSGGSAASTTLCSENCNPVTGVGCPVVGMKCDALLDEGPPERTFTMCLPAGTGTQGQTCSGLGDCAQGLSCFTVGSDHLCLTWCDRSNPQCPVGSCNSLSTPAIVGSTEYGVCQ